MTIPVKARGFQPGHPRYGGRQRGPNRRMQAAYEVIEELSARLGFNCDPLAQLVLLGSDQKQPIEIRMKALAEALPFCRPKLQATAHQVEAKIEADIGTFSITQILSTPELAEAAQKLAFSIAESEQREENTSPATIDLYNNRGIAVQRGPSEPLTPASEDEENGQ